MLFNLEWDINHLQNFQIDKARSEYMRHIKVVVVFMMMLLTGIVVYAEGITVQFEGIVLELTEEPQIQEGQVMLPLRQVAEALGVRVEWFQETRTAKLSRLNIRSYITAGFAGVSVNNRSVDLEVAPYIEQDRMFVPLHMFTVGLGYKTEWDPEQCTVKIEKDPDSPLLVPDFGGEFGVFYDACNAVYEEFQNGIYGEELFYLYDYGLWGGPQDAILLYKKDGTVTVEKRKPNGTVDTAFLEEAEFQEFKSFITENRIDELEDWNTFRVFDGNTYRYLHCTEEGAVSFYMNNPEFYGGSPVFDAGRDVYEELVNRFEQLL